jgi:signal transduction histidine kinase
MGTVLAVSHRDRPIIWLREHPSFADAALAGALTAVLLPGLWFVGDRSTGVDWRQPDLWAVMIIGLETLPLAWRRRYPRPVLAGVGLATIAFYAAGYPPIGAFPVVIAFYSVAAHGRRLGPLRPMLFTLAGLALSLAFYRGKVDVALYLENALVFVTAWIVGDNVRNRRDYTASLEERARRSEADNEADALQAVSEERNRIARELHDVVAHSMSVMVIQAGAARRVLGRDPSQALEAITSVESTGRQALDEMRRMLGVLRREGDDRLGRTPQPTVSQIDSLIDNVREAGLEVSLVVEGEPHPVPSGVDLSAYRIVQEALTNTLKHAGPARAQVVMRWSEHILELEVTDDGRGPPAGLTDLPLPARPPARVGLAVDAPVADRNVSRRGHGLVGMRERVALFGGELSVGPKRDGGYRVRARLPLEPSRP